MAFCFFLWQTAVGGSDEERALRKKKRKSKEDDRFNAVKSAIIKLLGDTCDVSGTYCSIPIYWRYDSVQCTVTTYGTYYYYEYYVCLQTMCRTFIVS